MSESKKIIILGACGNIGKQMVDYFLERLDDGYELIGTDVVHDDYIESRIPLIQLDINDREGFNKLPSENVHAVIDLVGPMPGRMEGYHPEIYVDTNVAGSFNVFQYAVNCHADRILYGMSFSDILKRSEKELVLKADQIFSKYKRQPKNEHYNSNYAVCFSIKAFIIRMPNVYFMARNENYSVKGVPTKIMFRELIDQATAGTPIEVWGDPGRLKDMTYVKDVAQLYYKACFTDREYGFYNAGTGIGTSLLDQIKGIIEVFCEDKVSEIIMRPDKQNAPQYIMDISKAKEELGYEPAYSYLDMLKDMKKERELERY